MLFLFYFITVEIQPTDPYRAGVDDGGGGPDPGGPTLLQPWQAGEALQVRLSSLCFFLS